MRWTKRGLIHTLAQASDWRKSHTQLPVVHVDEQRWRIFHSCRDSDGRSLPVFIDVEPGDPGNIQQTHDAPLLALGDDGDFDEHGVMPTAVLDVDDAVYMYYIGWSVQQDVPYRNAIGLAVSRDGGDSFEKHPERPLIGRSAIDPEFTGTFNVLRHGDTLHGYYMSCTGWLEHEGRLEPRYHIRYASSQDGIGWRRDGHVCIDFDAEEEGGIVAASTLRIDDQYHMWYCYRQDRDYRDNSHGNSYRIGYAISSDAINWQRQDTESGITISDHGWDREMICYPNVVRHAGTLYMFYNGNGFGQSGIGYATCEITA